MMVAYQIMIALEDLGEPVFLASRSDRAIHDYDLNRHDAERYLDSVA